MYYLYIYICSKLCTEMGELSFDKSKQKKKVNKCVFIETIDNIIYNVLIYIIYTRVSFKKIDVSKLQVTTHKFKGGSGGVFILMC